MKVERCKGFHDLTPEKMLKFCLVETAFRDSCLGWGCKEVRTPTLEYLYLFSAAGTLAPDRLNMVYSFLDWDGWSGERVVLRPDGTIPVARLYIDNMAEQGPAKLFYVTNVFAFEETGRKSRERWQGGVELIGFNSAIADVELLALALDILQRLGLNGIGVRLSHAGLIRVLLAKLELSLTEQTKIFDRLLDGDTEMLSEFKPTQPELVEVLILLLDMKGESSGFLRNIKALFSQKLPELESPLDNFIAITDLFETLGYDYQLDLASERGFEYYTGLIFHLFIGDVNIGGGGRYDALIPLMGGNNTPAAGFALYLDSLMKLVKPKASAKLAPERILIRVALETMKEGFSIASLIRKDGYTAEFALGGEKVADYGFILEVHSKAPKFILSDRLNGKKSKVESVDEVLAIIGRGKIRVE
ncbi:MAG: ATP phosphoribosyltransferase regulatory subunit [Dehalococcoidales bacterium]|jgi:histidyl-tRNA synthetase|nr:ATP phosphoribosyltransferase regulatory subunit [Dehalococcoidales bacterium]